MGFYRGAYLLDVAIFDFFKIFLVKIEKDVSLKMSQLFEIESS